MQQLLGSGKTAVLVERIINKIINEKIDIDRLLVVTFTNSAASEMREKILKAIYELLDKKTLPSETTNHLQRQITLLGKANICTIDSFCLDVIRNNFFEIEISPNFRIADTAEIDLLKQEVLEKLFEDKYENHDSDFELLVKTYTSYRDDTPLKDLILKIYTYIESNPFPLEWLNTQVEKFNLKTQDFAETPWGKILLNSMKNELEENINTLKSEQKRLSFESDLVDYERNIITTIENLETLYVNLDNWDKAYMLSQDEIFPKWPSSRKIQSEEKEKAKQIRDKVKKNFVSKRNKIFTSKTEEINQDLEEMYKTLTKLKNLIIDFDTEFNKSKKEKNIVDFSDIEHFALQILIKNTDGKLEATEIAKKYQEKFIEIAIDEYQDSNLVQEYILTSVSRKNNIFMVGDVKQSIYKFRQAMPDLFLDKYENYSENTANEKGLKIKLYKNFRSRSNILDFTNAIFKNIMSKSLGEIDYNEGEYLNLGASLEESKEDLKTEVDILNIVKQDNELSENYEEEKQEDYKEENQEQIDEEQIEDIELEAKFVAKKVRDLIDAKFQIYDNKLQKFRDIQFRDIVILLRSTKNKANIFEKELIKQNIDVYSDTSSEYLDSYEIQVIMDLLKIINNPYQDIPLVHVMLSSIGMFTDDDLLEIRLVDKFDDFYTALLKAKLSVNKVLAEKIKRFLDKIEDFRNKNKFMDLDELIWTIYEETGFLNYVSLMPNGAIRRENLNMLFERAKQYETASFKGLFNFINFMQKIKLGSGDLGSAKLIGENENVVRIMSIHKSKGLEFPVVFLSAVGSRFNQNDLKEDILLHQNLGIGAKYINYDRQIKYDTLTKLALKEKNTEESLSEEMRVLYVALTRAKEKLYITGVQKDFDKTLKKLQEEADIYKLDDGKINPNLLKKYIRYIDWILLVYIYNKTQSEDIMNLNVLEKKEILKTLKLDEEPEEMDIIQFLEKNSKDVKQEDLLKLKDELAFEYKYKDLRYIPTKASVTGIVHKDVINKVQEEQNEIERDYEEPQIEFVKPKFLKNTDEEKITPAQRGTLIHLCMKNLEFNKKYELKDVENLIEELKLKQIITQKEQDEINPKIILDFTKTDIWKELSLAKEYHKEEPFYINVPANEVVDTVSKENILVQGIIDLYYITEDDRLILLDYKTDFVKQGQEQLLIDRHKSQMMLYKEALENSLNKKVDKIYIYSTSLGKIVEIK